MAISLTHSTVVVVADDGTSPVGTDEWNAEHTLTNADNKVLGRVGEGSAGVTKEVSVLDEDNMASDSATALATQQSIKAYVDAAAGGHTDEEIQDLVGAMFTGNTETLVTVTYEDSDGTIDVVVDNDLSHFSNATSAFLTSAAADALFLTPTEGDAAYQAKDADLTSWAGVTRAAGFDTFVATPSQANLFSLMTDESILVSANIGSTVQAYDADLASWALITRAAGFDTFATTPSQANFMSLITDETFVVDADIGSTVQAYDADLGSWAGVTRAAGFDTFAATPTGANFASLLTDEPLPSTIGGTGNAFTKFTGPTTAEKSFALPDASATILYSGGALGTPSSGTLSSCSGYPAASQSASGIVELATAAEYWTGTDTGRVLAIDQITAAAALVALSSSSNLTAVNMAAGINFTLAALGENTTLSNPTGEKPGFSGAIKITTNATRTVAIGTQYLPVNGVEAFPLSILSTETVMIYYFVEAADVIQITAVTRRLT